MSQYTSSKHYKTDPMCGRPYVWETLRVGDSKQKQQGYFGMSVV